METKFCIVAMDLIEENIKLKSQLWQMQELCKSQQIWAAKRHDADAEICKQLQNTCVQLQEHITDKGKELYDAKLTIKKQSYLLEDLKSHLLQVERMLQALVVDRT